MSKTYVVTDIHGRLDLLFKAMDLFNGDHKVIFLGDYVDRGPDSAGVIDTLKRGRYQGLPWVFLMGNHEDMMIDAINMPHNSYHWVMNGGDTTLKSYENKGISAERDLSFLKSLDLYYEDKYRIYVHAFADPNEPDASKFVKQSTLWERYGRTEDIGWFGKHVVHGHTPLKEPFLGKNRTNLDTGAVFNSGYLSVGVFDDDTPGGPVEVIKIL
jgi:serine/threonine protein phosphatase 1